MKYIRTKDGKIYCFIDIHIGGNTIIGYTDNFDKNALDGGTYLAKENVIAQVDTIEKLIDRIYFVDDEDNFPHTINRLDKDMDKDKKLTECRLEIGGWVCWLKDYQKNNKGKIKGAIYTEKGIIYVAEMNERGDWVLYEK